MARKKKGEEVGCTGDCAFQEPTDGQLQTIEAEGKTKKRGRGRPKGSRNKVRKEKF